MPSRLPRLFRYCPIDSLDDALRLGWAPSATLHNPHGAYSVLVEWLCDCPAPWFREGEDRHRILAFDRRPA